MLNPTTSAIADKWTETEAQELRPGSMFRLAGTIGDSQYDREVFIVVNVYEVLTFGPSKLLIETESQDFDFKDSDIVLTVSEHEQTCSIEGAYFYA